MADSRPGTLLLIEVAETTWTAALCRMLERFRPAGLVFRKLNSPEATLEACRQSAHALDVMPFAVIEEEGNGPLTAFFPALPRALRLEPAEAAQAGDLIGRAMTSLGLNLNLAPTLDLEPRSSPGSGASPMDPAGAGGVSEVARRAQAFVGALSAKKALSCGRHFPGHPARQIPQPKAIVVDRSLAALWREDLVPYRTLGNKLQAVEISHAVHRAYDYEFLQPASLSSGVIEGLLRTKLRYESLALADASLAAQAAGIDIDEAVIRALAAGCDLVMVPGQPKLLEGICQSLGRATDSGRLGSARLSEATGRVKAVQRLLRRPARQVSKAQYSHLERDWEQFAQKLAVGRHA